MCLGAHARQSITTHQIARETQIPASYVKNVLQALRNAGQVAAQRGLHGAYCLAVPADELTVLHVIDAVAPIVHIRQCALGLAGHRNKLCPLHARLAGAIALFERSLGHCTVGQLLSRDTCIGRRCDSQQQLDE